MRAAQVFWDRSGGPALFEASPAASETAAFTLPGCGPSKTGFGVGTPEWPPKNSLRLWGEEEVDPPPKWLATCTAFEHTLSKPVIWRGLRLWGGGELQLTPFRSGSLVGPFGDPAGPRCWTHPAQHTSRLRAFGQLSRPGELPTLGEGFGEVREERVKGGTMGALAPIALTVS